MTSTSTDPRTLPYDPGRGERLRVADVMTAPVPTTDPDAPLFEVIHRLIAGGNEEIVVTEGKRPTGVITARGILALLEPDNAEWRPQRAIDLVTVGTPRLLPDLSVATAVRVLTGGRHEALPVVDYRGDLIGIVTQRQLVTLLADDGHSP